MALKTFNQRFSVGQSFRTVVEINQSVINRFVDLSGDENPIHLDAAEAKAYGYPHQVAHGGILVAMISKLIGMEIPGPGAVWMSQSIEWLQPIFLGDTVELVVTVDQVSSGARTLTLDSKATNQKGQLVMKGKSKAKVSEKITSNGVSSNGKTKVALITGGSRGIGASIARRLAQDGVAVAINYKESEKQANSLVESIRSDGGQAQAFQSDLSQSSNVSKLSEIVSDAMGKVDIVVHGASPLVQPIKATEVQYKDLEPFLKTYLGGALTLMNSLSPSMASHKFGRFIFLGTSYMFGAPPPNVTPYVVAKEALWGLVKSMATELGASGITTNLVSPGVTVTDFTADIPVRLKELEARKSPMRRLSTTDDIADLVAFLAGNSSGYLNGANIPLTGGPV